MSSLQDSASMAREAAVRGRDRLAAEPAQCDSDNDAVQRPHIPAARFPRSFSIPDGAPSPSEALARSAYYSVMARAVVGLPSNTRDARLALYDRAEIALTAELLKNPDISEEQAATERLAFERAIIKIEDDAQRKEMRKRSQAIQRQERHRPPVTSYLSLFLKSLTARFNCWAAAANPRAGGYQRLAAVRHFNRAK